MQDLFADIGYCFNYDTDVDSVLGLWHYNAKYGKCDNLNYASNKINKIKNGGKLV